MRPVRAVHEYMFRRLMVPAAVATRAICAWNISEVQVSIQTYAFDSDVSDESAFDLLKAVPHLYRLVEQVRPLCRSGVNICDAFPIFFPSLLSLTSVILHYCDAVTSRSRRSEG